MKYWSRTLQTNTDKSLIILRFLIGYVFIMEGIQKFIYSDELGIGRFIKIGIPYAEILAPVVGFCEILFGFFILIGLFTRLSSIILIIIMIIAIITTKIPVLFDQGIFHFSHKSRNDLSMLFCSIYLLIKGCGQYGVDFIISRKLNE